MRARRSFRDVFGSDPAAGARAPGRVNLMGDHTDYNGGFVLPTVIPQETLVEIDFGEDVHQLYSANFDRMVRFGSGALTDFARYVGGCLRVLEQRGIEIPPLNFYVASNVPVGAGLSSSAALEIATLRALDCMLGLGLTLEDVARLAHRAEVGFAGVDCGIMDQMACSLGQPNRMLFLDTMTLETSFLPIPKHGEFLVMDSGLPRALAESHYNRRRAECEEASAMLGVSSLRMVKVPQTVEALPSPLRERARHVVTENARVLAALKADAAVFGRLMSESHASLRDDYAVSIPQIDALVASLQQEPDVFGARLTGAGFGGCCVALVSRGKALEIGQRVASRRLAHRPSVIVPSAVADMRFDGLNVDHELDG